ncbi:MAG: DUF4981 domain-containing protein, partial [Armatimonadetes bacterium]|nr:DUF4981 domain-containing protein [Candidatus Hippobium faecium]
WYTVIKAEIENRYDFSDLSHLMAIWSVTDEGKTVQRGSFDLNILPGEKHTEEIQIIETANEFGFLNIKFVLKNDTDWADCGYIVAESQYKFIDKFSNYEDFNKYEDYDFPVYERDKYLTVFAGRSSVSFSKLTGHLVKWTYDEDDLIKSPVKINFWRPLIDNETFGPAGNLQKSSLMDKLLEDVKDISYNIEDGYCFVTVKTIVAPPYFSAGFNCKYVYIIYPDGRISVFVTCEPFSGKTDFRMPKELLKFGVSMGIGKEYSSVKWLGRGPGENYPDTKFASPVGLYEKDVSDMYEPYPMPQEYGARCDCRFAEFRNGKGRGIRVFAENFIFSVREYSDEKIDNAKHTNELTKDDYLTLCIDSEQRGVGSGACGPDTLDKYKAETERKEFEFMLVPLG